MTVIFQIFYDRYFSIDAHAPASLLKLWYRELYDPLIPDDLYNESIQTDDPKEVLAIVDRLTPLNRLVNLLLNYEFF